MIYAATAAYTYSLPAPSRRQDGATRIDEAAAVYTDAVGIGHNDRSRPAGHFHKSVEGRRAAGGHFVYDDLGGAAIHMGVTFSCNYCPIYYLWTV